MNYVIEHQTRGVYTHSDYQGKPHFKYSVLRSEGKVFFTEQLALERLLIVRKHRGCRGVYIFAWNPNLPGRGRYIRPIIA